MRASSLRLLGSMAARPMRPQPSRCVGPRVLPSAPGVRLAAGTPARRLATRPDEPGVAESPVGDTMFGGFASRKEQLDFTRVLEEYEVPTPERIMQKNQRRRFSEFSNETLAIMASNGVHGAFKERMLREIMRVDKCAAPGVHRMCRARRPPHRTRCAGTYIEAYSVLARMNRQLEEGTVLHRLPYQAAISTAWALGVVVIPMGVFHKGCALWFAEQFVHAEIPPPDEIDTVWKVGTWTWNWMEPIIGTWSFILLSLQLIRANMTMIDAKPFNERIITARADNLHRNFPMYEREIVRDYSKSAPFGRDSFRARHGYPANSVVPHRAR